MGYAEFEEKEFERPLYNQLEIGTSYVWSPGQCFEKFIGIDYSLYTFYDLSKRLGIKNMPPGVSLKNYNLGYIWKLLGRTRELPDFQLNMFIQAKRPYEYKNGLPKYGYTKRCFKFKTSSVQQSMLEKLDVQLNGNALVVYAAPVFSTLRELYKFTANKSMIENTIFPTIKDLKGHQAWVYDSINRGVGCSEPEEKSTENILNRINDFIKDRERTSNRFIDENSLQNLNLSIENTLQGMYDVHIAEYFNRKDEIYRSFRQYESYNENRYIMNNLISFMLINEFCDIYNLDWFVLG